MSDQPPIADLPEWLASQIIQESEASPPHVRDLPPMPRRPGVVSWVAKLAESAEFRAALVELGWRAPPGARVPLCRSCGRPFRPTHNVLSPGPTTRHPFTVAEPGPLICPNCGVGRIWSHDDGTVCTNPDVDAGGAPGCGAAWDSVGLPERATGNHYDRKPGR